MTHTVGYAPGAFDLFHIGHLNLLRHARSRCDYLVAGVVSDEMAELAKGRPPVVPLVERLEIVRSLRYVDAAFVETVPDKTVTWQHVRFNVLFKGDDWRGTPKGARLEKAMRSVGVEVVHLPYTVHTSSTQLRRALDALGSPGTQGAPETPGTRSMQGAQPALDSAAASARARTARTTGQAALRGGAGARPPTAP